MEDQYTKEFQQVIDTVTKLYREQIKQQKEHEKIMSQKKFNFGDLVVKKQASNGDRLFGFSELGVVGLIVGHYDLDGLDGVTFSGIKRDMYRVYWNDNSSYQGEEVEGLELYDGPCPDHLKNIPWNNLFFTFKIPGKTKGDQ